MVPDLRDLAAGCRFADRCPLRIDKCVIDEPPLEEVAPGRLSRCWRANDVQPEASP
jgi:oligopeptide/dipeptide ABC transporter ATP-binding protein